MTLSTNGKPSSGLSPESIAPFLAGIAAEPIVVGFSGGVDSTVLLHLLAACREQGLLKTLSAVHIHHGLSELADDWQAFCQRFCDALNIPLTVAHVELSGTSGGGIEQEARQARYDVFRRALEEGGFLLMGHHQDDQAETLLLRLFRGTGPDGLQGIPKRRPLGNGEILRPLLDVSRADIEHYARQHQLQWIEDRSNADKRFSRNFLRHQIIPEIEQRWPGASRRMAELADDITEINQQLAQQVRELLVLCTAKKPEWLLGQQPLLAIEKLCSLNEFQQNQVVREWLKSQGLMMPGRQMLNRLFTELIAARADAEPLLNCGSYYLRRFRNYLVVDSGSVAPVTKMLDWDWQSTPELELPDGWKLSARQQDSHKCCLPGEIVQIRWRQHIDANEKIAVAGRAGRKVLKRWLQEYNVPHWLRDRVPFIYHREQMVMAPGLWVCEGFSKRGCTVILKVADLKSTPNYDGRE